MRNSINKRALALLLAGLMVFSEPVMVKVLAGEKVADAPTEEALENVPSEEELVNETEIPALGTANSSYADAEEMILGGVYEASMNADETVYYKFIPQTDGVHVFYSTGDFDVYAVLYDMDMEELSGDDDGGEGMNFRIEQVLEAGKTYYLMVETYDDDTVSGIHVGKENLSISYEDYITVNYGDNTELSVTAVSDVGSVVYQWYRYDEEEGEYIEIEGATESSYSVKADGNAASRYKCEVTNGVTTKTAGIRLVVKSLSVEYEGYPTVKYGETAVMEVHAESLAGNTLTYQWYRYDEEEWDYIEIEGATESSYSVKADEDMAEEYRCRISDEIDIKYAYFYPETDTGLSVSWQKYQYGRIGEDITFHVAAESNYGNLTYRWFADGEESSEVKGSEYTVHITEDVPESYRCVVSDGGMERRADFELEIGEADAKRAAEISLSWHGVVQNQIMVGEKGNYRSIGHGSYSVNVAYEDGTQEKNISGYKKWADLRKDAHGNIIPGTYKSYICYKGAACSYDVHYADISECGKLLTENEEITGAAGQSPEAYQYYCFTASETGSYRIRLSDVSGKGILLNNNGTECNLDRESVIDAYVTAGKTYYLAIGSREESRFSYKILLENGSVKRSLQLGQEECVNGRTIYVYTPEQSGYYQLSGLGMCSGYGLSGRVYDKDMTEIYRDAGAVFYLRAGNTYNFEIVCGFSSTGEMFTLNFIKSVTLAANIVSAGEFGTDISWTLDLEGVMTVAGTGAMPNLEVWGIQPWATENIKKLVVENGITEIGDCSFDGCDSLEEVALPDSITRIGIYAFSRCPSLQEVRIPAGVTDILGEAFFRCTSLERVEFVDVGNVNYIGVAAFEETKWIETQKKGDFTIVGDILLDYTGSDSEITIPSQVKKIGVFSLASENLQKVHLTENVTNVYEYAFSGSGLKEMTVPGNVTKIAYSAFSGCTALENILIEDGIQKLSYDTFYDCSSLKEVTIPDSVTEIEGWTFFKCPALKEITIPASVTVLGDYAVGYMYNEKWEKEKTDMTIQCWSNTAAHQYALDNGFSYTLLAPKVNLQQACQVSLSVSSAEYTGSEIRPAVTVTYGTNILKEGTDYRVSYSDNIKTGTAKVTVIGKGNYTGTVEKTFTITAKADHTDHSKPIVKQSISKAVVKLSKTSCSYNGKAQKPFVTSVKLGSTVLKSGTDYTVTYKNNKNIGKASVTITGKGNYTGTVTRTFTISAKKGTVFTVGSYKYKITSSKAVAFAGLKSSKTKKVTIPKTVKIGGKTFKVTSVADKALQNKKVTSVTIGANVKTIGSNAFKNCAALKSVTVPAKVTSIGTGAFAGCKKLAVITMKSAKLKTVGKNAFKGINAKAKIKVPSSKLAAYKKLLKGKGQGKNVKITK